MNDADGNLALLPERMDLGAVTMVSDMVPTGFTGPNSPISSSVMMLR